VQCLQNPTASARLRAARSGGADNVRAPWSQSADSCGAYRL